MFCFCSYSRIELRCKEKPNDYNKISKNTMEQYGDYAFDV